MTSATMRAACAALAVWAAACGGDESDYETQTNPEYAGYAISELSGIRADVTAGSPDAVASRFMVLSYAVRSIITPVLDEQQALRRPPAPIPLVGDCACDGAGCRFAGCGADDGTWTIDGTIDVSGETYAFDLSMTQHSVSDTATDDLDRTISGEVTIGATAVDGHLTGEIDTLLVIEDDDGTLEVEGWADWSIDLASVGLDDARCPVSGTLAASVSEEVAVDGRDADYSGSGTVAFGPACGDAVVAP